MPEITRSKSAITAPSSCQAPCPKLAPIVAAAIAGLVAGSQLACSGAESDASDSERGEITSSTVIVDMTLESFTEDCDARGGVVEQHASCAGVNKCRGFSYDDATHVFTEHTCRALNTCSGFSCVIPTES